MDKLYYTKHHVDKTDYSAIEEALNSGWLTQGPSVAQFEKEFSEYVGVPYALTVNNGTSALQLAVAGLGLKEGQKVLVTSMSFVASANCILYQGGEVEFVDIDSKDFNISIASLENKLRGSDPNTYSGIIVVDFAGLPCRLEEISKLAKSYGLWVVEDASHAPGSVYVDKSNERYITGSAYHADVVTFSFHPAKHIACGEGGMVTTRNKDIFDRMSSLRTHGIIKDTENPNKPWMQDMVSLGYNFRMPDILASLGSSQLKKLDASVKRRNEIAEIYNREFSSVSNVETPFFPESSTHAFHLYVLKAEKRDELFLHLKEKGINCQIHYVPIYRMSFYKELGHSSKEFPACEEYFSKCISLPMYPTLTKDDVARVVEAIKSFY